MKKIILIFIIITNQVIFGQSDNNFKKNAIYFDVMGHTRNIFNLNYERTIYKISDYFYINARTGVGYTSGKVEEQNLRFNSMTTIPNVILLQIGKKNHFANIGIGYSMTFASHLKDDRTIPTIFYPRFDSAYSISIGYKFTIHNIIMQVYPVYIIPKNEDNEVSFGISFGYTW